MRTLLLYNFTVIVHRQPLIGIDGSLRPSHNSSIADFENLPEWRADKNRHTLAKRYSFPARHSIPAGWGTWKN